MTTAELAKKRLVTLRAYQKAAKANPAGARARLIKTGIYTKSGKLRPEYGGEPAKEKA